MAPIHEEGSRLEKYRSVAQSCILSFIAENRIVNATCYSQVTKTTTMLSEKAAY